MEIKNIRFVNKDLELVQNSINIIGTDINGFGTAEDDCLDFDGLVALPGFIDIHTHGGSGADACDKSEESLKTLSMHYARHGVTSFCPTTMTLPHDDLMNIFKSIEDYKGREAGAYIQGINMEGPYISLKKCGAQNTKYIRPASFDEFSQLNDVSKVSLVDLAPETEGALDFALKASKLTVCSVAHTAASYDETTKAFYKGFTHVTHFYNAMSGLSHREPGVVGAVFENKNVTAELICDGFHLAPAAVRIAFKVLGDDRCVVISDSLSCADRKDGEYVLGRQKVLVKNGQARLENGTIAGSTANLFDEFKNLLSFGIPFKSALKACSVNPAKVIGAYDRCGSIEKGKSADLIFVDSNMELKHVMIRGKLLF